VENTSTVDSVTISSLTDDVYGDLDGKGSCDVPQTLAAGRELAAARSRGAVGGNAGSTPQGRCDGVGHGRRRQPPHRERRRAVTITNVPSSIAVTKTATPTTLPEPGGQRDLRRQDRQHLGGRTRSRSRASSTTCTGT
jgi:hypothetical protein